MKYRNCKKLDGKKFSFNLLKRPQYTNFTKWNFSNFFMLQ